MLALWRMGVISEKAGAASGVYRDSSVVRIVNHGEDISCRAVASKL